MSMEDLKRKQLFLDYMYLQSKTPNTKYNSIILCTFKIIQTALSLACLSLHINAYVGRELPMPHNTLFCGTYLGYSIVSGGLIIGYVVGRRATPAMDLFICFCGGLLYNISGIMSMVYAKNMPYVMLESGEYAVHLGFIKRCVAQSVMSTATALMYWIDFFINWDIYQGMKRKRRSALMDEVIELLDDVESDDLEEVISGALESLSTDAQEESVFEMSISANISQLIKEQEEKDNLRKTLITDDDPLELHCICIEASQYCKKLLKPLLQKKTYMRRLKYRAPAPEYDIEEFLELTDYYREHDARFNAYYRPFMRSGSQFYLSTRRKM